MPDAQAQFAAKLKALLEEAREIPASTSQRIASMLDALQRDLQGRITSIAAGTRTFTESQLRHMLNEAESRLREFRDRATPAIQAGQERAYRIGEEIVDQPMAAVNLDFVMGGLPREQLVIAQGYSADLVRGLTSDARTKLNSVLRRALLGGQQMSDIVAQISVALGGDGSFFGPIGSRALMIARTEIGRAQSLATQARMERYAERVPEMRKRWRHSPQEHPRLDHIAMDGQTVPVDGKFETPKGIEIAFPRDPAAPAGETINCGCFVVPVPPQFGTREFRAGLPVVEKGDARVRARRGTGPFTPADDYSRISGGRPGTVLGLNV